jgi:hypothetical protein
MSVLNTTQIPLLYRIDAHYYSEIPCEGATLCVTPSSPLGLARAVISAQMAVYLPTHTSGTALVVIVFASGHVPLEYGMAE